MHAKEESWSDRKRKEEGRGRKSVYRIVDGKGNFHEPDVVVTLQTIELRNRLRASSPALTDVPDLDAPLATSVNVLGRIRDRDRAHDLAVTESINLARVTRYPASHQSVQREICRLHLSLARHVETVRPVEQKSNAKIEFFHRETTGGRGEKTMGDGERERIKRRD